MGTLKRHIEDVIAMAMIAAIATGLLYPVFQEGALPLNNEAPFFHAPWAEARPPALDHRPDPIEALHTNIFYPSYLFIQKTAAAGDSMLWNPMENGGYPFLAAWRTRALSPFSLPFYVLPLHTAFQLSAFLKLLIAGLTAYYTARRLGYLVGFSFFVAVAFQISGGLLLWLQHPVGDVLPWIPLLLLSIERMALGQYRYWPNAAVVLALMLLGGAPLAVGGLLVYAALFLFLRQRLDPALPQLGPWMVFAGSLVLSAGLAAVQIIPFAELQLHGKAASLPSGGGGGWGSIFSTFFPMSAEYGPPMRREYGDALVYLGPVALLLTVLWCSLRHCVTTAHRARIDALLVTGLLAQAFAVCAGRWILTNDEYLSIFLPENILIIQPFAFALAGAAAAEHWLELNPEQCTSALKRLLILAPCLIAAALILALPELGKHGVSTQTFPILLAGLAGLITIALVGATLLHPSARLFGYSLAVVAGAQMALSLQPAMAFSDPDTVFPETEFIQALQKTGGRVAGSSLRDWPLAGNGVSQMFGTSGVRTDAYGRFKERVLSSEPSLLRYTAASALVLTRKDIQGPFAGLRPMLRIREVFSTGAVLFDNLGSAQRAYLEPVSNGLDRSHQAGNGSFTAEGNLPYLGAYNYELGDVRVVESSNASVRLEARAAKPAALVLSDTFYPGWRATVNGEAIEIEPANGPFRAVKLEPGEHEIEFTYEPKSFRNGLMVSGAAGLICVSGFAALLFGALRRRMRAYELVEE